MNDQERQIISGIFSRLEQTAGQPRDADAERLIADKIRAQPYAPYAMAQALYVQEEALKSLNEQVEQLRAENEQLSRQGSGGGGLLSSIFGGGSARQAPAGGFGRPGQQQPGYGGQPGYGQQPGQGQGGPWGGAPQGGQGGPWGGQPQQAAGGGGFLRGALTTAAGVAGGMVVGNALMNAFSGGHQSLGNFSNTDMASLGGLPGGSDGGIQNAVFDQGGGGGGMFEDASFDDGGGFDGGDDSSWT